MANTNKKGFWRRNKTKTQEVRSVAPDTANTPPTWQEFNQAYGGRVTTQQALGIPAVAAAVQTIVTTISQLDMMVERQNIEIDSVLVTRPDANRSKSAFLKRTATNLATTGNAYWRLYRNSDGAVVNMEVLPNKRVHVTFDDKGTKFYEYTDSTGRQFKLTNNSPTMNGQVEHIKLFELEDELLGIGPIQINNEALYSIAELRFYTDRFIAESRRPSGIYSFNADMTPAELAQAKKQIMENRTTGEPDALPKGVTYQSIMVTPEASQLSFQKKESVLEVARIFGLPPHKLSAAVDGNSMTYQNIQDADRAWVRDSLEQYLQAIEDAMTNVLPRGQQAHFDTEAWLRAADVNKSEGGAPDNSQAQNT